MSECCGFVDRSWKSEGQTSLQLVLGFIHRIYELHSSKSKSFTNFINSPPNIFANHITDFNDYFQRCACRRSTRMFVTFHIFSTFLQPLKFSCYSLYTFTKYLFKYSISFSCSFLQLDINPLLLNVSEFEIR